MGIHNAWTDREEKQLWRMWGYAPLSRIAEHIGRTETACIVKSKRLNIPAIRDWPHVKAEWQLAPMLGLDRKTVWRHMTHDILPVMTLYKRNEPCMVVDLRELVQWLKCPANWLYVPPDKIQDPTLKAVVREARREWGDRWLTVGETADLMDIERRTVNKLIHQDVLPARRWGNWHVKRSDARMISRIRYGGTA